MATVKLDAAAVRDLADQVLDSADRLDEIHWPSVASDALAGSSVRAATATPAAEERLATVAVHLRTWASAVRASVAVIEQAELLHEARLDGYR